MLSQASYIGILFIIRLYLQLLCYQALPAPRGFNRAQKQLSVSETKNESGYTIFISVVLAPLSSDLLSGTVTTSSVMR